jgi:hypothetical protein
MRCPLRARRRNATAEPSRPIRPWRGSNDLRHSTSFPAAGWRPRPSPGYVTWLPCVLTSFANRLGASHLSVSLPPRATLGRWRRLLVIALRAAAAAGSMSRLWSPGARELAVMGWVRPTGEVHAEGAHEAVQALVAFLGDGVATEPAGVEGHEQFAIRGVRRRGVRRPGASGNRPPLRPAPESRRGHAVLGRAEGPVARSRRQRLAAPKR